GPGEERFGAKDEHGRGFPGLPITLLLHGIGGDLGLPGIPVAFKFLGKRSFAHFRTPLDRGRGWTGPRIFPFALLARNTPKEYAGGHGPKLYQQPFAPCRSSICPAFRS